MYSGVPGVLARLLHCFLSSGSIGMIVSPEIALALNMGSCVTSLCTMVFVVLVNA